LGPPRANLQLLEQQTRRQGLEDLEHKQPNQNIGLFGANNQTKPATGFGGFGQPASSAPSAFGTTGGFGATTSQSGGLFGANNQNKPATGFGGFGQPTSSAPSAFGATTGGFGANTGGGLFGANNQNKPGAFSFNTGAATAPTQSFGSFGATNNTGGGGLFGGAQSKPGGLFGSTNTFGTATAGFGGNTTGGFGGFGSNTGTSFGGGGLNFQQVDSVVSALTPGPVSVVEGSILVAQLTQASQLRRLPKTRQQLLFTSSC